MTTPALPLAHRELWCRRTRQAGYDAHELARLYGVSARQLRRKSGDLYALPLHVWLLEQRLIAATHYLLETGSVKQAANRAGYRRIATFIEHFYQYHQITPARHLEWFRRRCLAGWEE